MPDGIHRGEDYYSWSPGAPPAPRPMPIAGFIRRPPPPARYRVGLLPQRNVSGALGVAGSSDSVGSAAFWTLAKALRRAGAAAGPSRAQADSGLAKGPASVLREAPLAAEGRRRRHNMKRVS